MAKLIAPSHGAPAGSGGRRPPAGGVGDTQGVGRRQTSVNGAINGAVIQFDTGKASLAPGSHALFDGVAAALKPCDGTVVEVAGHTDATGRADANMALSAARAQAVVDYLKADGAPGARLTAKGYGATRPLDPARAPEADKKNRRIDFTVAAASSWPPARAPARA